MSIKRRLPFLLLPVVFLLSENFLPFLSSVPSVAQAVAQAAPSVSPKKGQMIVSTRTPKQGTWPIELTVSLFVEVPQQTLWGILTDYESLPDFVPHLEECTVVDRVKDRVYLEEVFKCFPLTMRLDLEIKEEPPNRVVFKRYSGNMKMYEGYWKIDPASPETSIFTLKVKAQPDFPVPQKVLTWILRTEIPKGMLEMRKQALTVSGQRVPGYSIEVLSR
ncbi:MAG: SRPBCC family protein [Candidatus Bathyanammoxibius sp.]